MCLCPSVDEMEASREWIDEHKRRANAVTLVDRILSRGATDGASDIHIEPRSDNIKVRFRIDGLLVERPSFPIAFRHSVASRLKVMANLDIAEKRLPQDGAFRMRMGQQDIDIRLSTFPTEYGEKVVLRLLRQDGQLVKLVDLGVPLDMQNDSQSSSPALMVWCSLPVQLAVAKHRPYILFSTKSMAEHETLSPSKTPRVPL